jgi:dihydropteroate synthase
MNRAMLGRMVLRAAGPCPPGTALIAVASRLADASAAVQAGADLIDLAAAPAEVITAFRARHPGILVCADGPHADVVRDAAVARSAGALLICEDARTAQLCGMPADRVLVDVLPAMLPAVVQAGLAALVDADRAAGLAAACATADTAEADTAEADTDEAGAPPIAGVVALAAISSWLGAAAVRTRYPVQVRRALDMAASIRGIRVPARTVRGLA